MMNAADAPLRVLIVDDEPLARERIRDLLREQADVTVLDECPDGPSAIDAIRRLTPDLVFLDVQMPGADGFEVIDQIGPANMPPVIFVTAYDRYALHAFDVHALDYLLKPFDRERFEQALRRAQMQRVARRADVGRRLLELVQELRPGSARTDRLVVKSGGRIFFLRTDEIDWVQAEGNYVRLHQGGQSHLIRETMTAMERRLDPQRFFRIHRSSIVNIERVRELQPWFNGEYRVLLHDGTKLTLSRGYRDRLQTRLGESL
jgi:two-component system LytT family response regulator